MEKRLPWTCPTLMVSCLLGLTSCTPAPPIPPAIELHQRYPVKTVLVDGHHVAYLDVGQGPTVILIHGFGGSMWNWEQQQIPLSSTYRVVTVDLLGSGLSDKPAMAYTPNALLEFFHSFMDQTDIGQATLMGNSSGAALAMGMALTYPDRVRSLILVSGFPPNLTQSLASPSYKRLVEYRPPLWLAKMVNWVGGRWLTRFTLQEIVYDHSLLTPMVIERSYQNRSRSDFLPPLLSLIEHFEEWDEGFGKRLGQISKPTLILWGTEDQVFPVSVGQGLHQTIKGSVLQTVPKAGHLLQWEKPDPVNRFILDFLQRPMP